MNVHIQSSYENDASLNTVPMSDSQGCRVSQFRRDSPNFLVETRLMGIGIDKNPDFTDISLEHI